MSKTHVRLFNQFADETTYMFDFQATWFSKFVAPECILNNELEILQVKCQRENFLNGFNILDDVELEFLVNFDAVDTGRFMVIKTREFFIVEATVPFEIEKEMQCDENYEFPENQLLLDSEAKSLKNIRGIFKTKSKTEILNLHFTKELLIFKGEINSVIGYEVKVGNQKHYAHYLSASDQKSRDFSIYLSLKHILNLLKICEMIEGKFMTAMEQLTEESCVAFIFTNSEGDKKDFKFCIGIGNVKFERFDQVINDDQFLQQQQQQRLKKNQVNGDRQMVNNNKQQLYQQDQDNQSAMAMKLEENMTADNRFSHMNHQPSHLGAYDNQSISAMHHQQKMRIKPTSIQNQTDQSSALTNQVKKRSAMKGVINDREESHRQQQQQYDIKMEVENEGDYNNAAGTARSSAMKMGSVNKNQLKQNKRNKQDDDDEENDEDEEMNNGNEDDEEEQEDDGDDENDLDLMERKKNFYKEVDQEEFF
eukprot:403368343